LNGIRGFYYYLVLEMLDESSSTTKRVVENAATGEANATRRSYYLLITLFNSIHAIFSAMKLELSIKESLVPLVTLIVNFGLLVLLVFSFPTTKLGIFISGSAGSIFYFATAIVVVIYCESTLVFDMIAIILAFAMNVQCFICQDPILELDRTSLGESVVGLFAAIVSCISGGYKSQSTLLILIPHATSALFKILDVVLHLTCAYCGSAWTSVNYFRSRLSEAFD